jgi:hypothetical protein
VSPVPAALTGSIITAAIADRQLRGDFSDDRPNSIRCSTAKSARSF